MKKTISIVIPAYNEEASVDELARRLTLMFDANPAYDFEAIIVENGSLDRTMERLIEIHHRDPRFKIVQLARNFRMDGGVTAGLQYACGDAAVIMTADLQDPPELISQLICKWEEGYENIFGIVKKRQGTPILRRINSYLFYLIADRLTGGRIPRNASDFRLVDRKVYETINTIHERNRFVRGLFAWVGYKSIGIEFERPPRYAGESNAHTLKVIELALKGIFAHSYVPLKLILVTGLTISVTAFVMLIYIVGRSLLFGVPFPGFGTIMSVMLLMFGMLFTMLGIISEYVGLIYEEVKARPNFITRRTIGFDDGRRTAQ